MKKVIKKIKRTPNFFVVIVILVLIAAASLLIHYARKNEIKSVANDQAKRLETSAALVDTKSYNQAIDTIGDASKYKNEDRVKAYFILAESNYALKKYDDAIADYQELLDLQSTNNQKSFYNNLLGNIYRDQGKYDQALASYKLATEQNSKNTIAWTNLIYLDISQGDQAAASANYDAALAANPGNPEIIKIKQVVNRQ